MTDLPPNLPPPPGDYGLPPPPGDYGQPPPTPGGPGYSLPPPPGEYSFSPAPGLNKLAIWSLVSSTFGIVICGFGPIAGLILGFMALKQIKHTGESGRGIALAGMIIGAVALVFLIPAFMQGMTK